MRDVEMPNDKKVFLPFYYTGYTTLYARVLQVATGWFLDNAGSPPGIFRLSPTDSNIPLSEYSALPSIYRFIENRSVWPNGEYNVFGYDPGSGLFAGGPLFILDDEEVSQSDLLEFMQLIKKIESGNWQLADNQWIYKDEYDNELMRFNVFDASGSPSTFNIFKRIRV
jgi:hypothetical protein